MEIRSSLLILMRFDRKTRARYEKTTLETRPEATRKKIKFSFHALFPRHFADFLSGGGKLIQYLLEEK